MVGFALEVASAVPMTSALVVGLKLLPSGETTTPRTIQRLRPICSNRSATGQCRFSNSSVTSVSSVATTKTASRRLFPTRVPVAPLGMKRGSSSCRCRHRPKIVDSQPPGTCSRMVSSAAEITCNVPTLMESRETIGKRSQSRSPRLRGNHTARVSPSAVSRRTWENNSISSKRAELFMNEPAYDSRAT